MHIEKQNKKTFVVFSNATIIREVSPTYNSERSLNDEKYSFRKQNDWFLHQ